VNSDSKMIQPLAIRTLLAFAALISAALVVYASLVPLTYSPRPFDETVAVFKNTPWLQLGIGRRADWVANGLVLLPAGFLAAGAVDWRRKKRWLLLLASPLIIAFLVAMVFGIEFVQIWFPPRVVSQNDIFAGVIGSIGGVLIWWLGGRNIVAQIEQFILLPPGMAKWKLLMNFGVFGLLIYNLMPMDFLVSLTELKQKWDTGGINLVPLDDFQFDRKSVLVLGLAGLRLVPFTFVSALVDGFWPAIRNGLAIAFLLEIVKVPVHSRHASATDILASVFGVLVAASCAPTMLYLMRVFDRSLFWFVGAVGCTGVMIFGFLSRFQHIERDPSVLAQRMRGILAVPFARAHSSSEFEAGENILIKAVVFGGFAFLLTGWCSRARTKATAVAFVVLSVMWCVGIGLGIELTQVYLPPLVPDATDFIVYGIGAVAGVVGFRILIPPPQR
jgi:VanZ family protein